ncbi:hypothetical protein NXX40_14840 [Parabacteroides distasonis]|nr:hypothetical protein [Parabacteroides distasonis]
MWAADGWRVSPPPASRSGFPAPLPIRSLKAKQSLSSFRHVARSSVEVAERRRAAVRCSRSCMKGSA